MIWFYIVATQSPSVLYCIVFVINVAIFHYLCTCLLKYYKKEIFQIKIVPFRFINSRGSPSLRIGLLQVDVVTGD